MLRLCDQIGYETRSLLCVLRLHDGPIRALAVHEGFAVTASEDCWVRLWPLDFSDYLMEASHTTVRSISCVHSLLFQ
jgi:WD repeat-containing protein 90